MNRLSKIEKDALRELAAEYQAILVEEKFLGLRRDRVYAKVQRMVDKDIPLAEVARWLRISRPALHLAMERWRNR